MLQAQRMQGAASMFDSFCKYGFLCFFCYCAMQGVQSLSGQTTVADIGLNLGTDIKLSQAVAWIFGGSAIGYGMRERRLRQKNIARTESQLKTHELRLNESRGTSGLTIQGHTNPGDKP